MRLYEEAVGPEGDKSPRWNAEYQGKVKSDYKKAADHLRKRGVAATGMRGLNTLVVFYSAYSVSKHEAVTVPLNVMKGFAEAATLADDSTKYSKTMRNALPSWVGGVAGIATTAADVALAGAGVYASLTDTDARGQSKVQDPNWLGTIGHATNGSFVVIGWCVGGLPGAVFTTVGTVVSEGFMLWQAHREAEELEAADPLRWIDDGSLWGKGFTYTGARAGRVELMKAVHPDPAVTADPTAVTLRSGERTKPIKKVVEAEGEDILENGFSFPTSVAVATGEECRPPGGLRLDVALGYLPRYGTLMIDSKVIPAVEGIAGEDIRCAVHYVKVDGGHRYRVQPAGAPLPLPTAEMPVGRHGELGDFSLPEWAAENNWAWAEPESQIFAGGRARQSPHLKLHLGEIWPVEWTGGKEGEEIAETTLRLSRGAAGGQVDRERRAQAWRAVEAVAPTAHWEGPEGLQGVLESGEFRVTGDVYFSPLQPFQSDPEIPSSSEEVSHRLLAQQEIPEYVHG